MSFKKKLPRKIRYNSTLFQFFQTASEPTVNLCPPQFLVNFTAKERLEIFEYLENHFQKEQNEEDDQTIPISPSTSNLTLSGISEEFLIVLKEKYDLIEENVSILLNWFRCKQKVIKHFVR